MFFICLYVLFSTFVGNKPKEIESSTINENLEKVKNVDHLKKGTVEIVETCLRSLDTIRNEKSIDMEVSVQKTTDRLNQSNEFESQMSLCTEIGSVSFFFRILFCFY